MLTRFTGKRLYCGLEIFLAKGRKSKAIAVTGREGPHGYETSRLAHFLNSSQMAVRLSALSTFRPLPTGRFLELISVGG
jgi:hypothetical protein